MFNLTLTVVADGSGEFDRGADQDIGADGGAILGATSRPAPPL
jgi:hypothetical protein